MAEEKEGVHISNVKGDVIGGKVSGTGNIVGERVTVSGTINISHQQLQSIPNEYARSLKDFEKGINELFQKHNIPKEQVDEIQEDIDSFTNEVKSIRSEKDITTAKKITVKGKFASFTEKILKVLPKTAETIAAFTPLAPFSKLIGEGVEQLVKAIQRDV